MNFNFDEFMHNVNLAFLREDHSQRYGQYLMNSLVKDYPDIQVPEDCDCFYDNSKCPNLLVFLSRVESQ